MNYLKMFSIGSEVKCKTIESNVTILSATIKNNNHITYKVGWQCNGDRYSCDIEDVEITSTLRESNSSIIKQITNKIVSCNSSVRKVKV